MFKRLQVLCGIDNKTLLPCIVLSILEGILIVLPYIVLSFILQEITSITSISHDYLVFWLSIIGVIFILRFWVTRATINTVTHIAYSYCSSLRVKVAHYLYRVPMGFFMQYESNDIQYRLSKDIGFTENMVAHFFSHILTTITVIVGLSVLFFWLDWRLALSLLLGIPLALLLQSILRKGADELSAALHTQTAKTNGDMMRWVKGIQTCKMSGNIDSHCGQLEQQIRKTQSMTLRHELRVSLAPIVASLLPEIGFGLFLTMGVYFYLNDQVPWYIIAIFIIGSARLYSSMSQVATALAESRFMNQAVKRVENLLNHSTVTTGNNTATAQGDIRLQEVFFTYPASTNSLLEKPVLCDINLTIPPRSLTAIVGASGSGKTTLLHLLARFYPVNQGKILLSDHSIESWGDVDFYRQVALVSQDIQLFDDTIMNNLLMVKSGLTQGQIYAACQQAQCHHFICSLPKAYDTNIGESGAYLSGGEKQRLALARALLSDASIILLDEITSALDVKNEQSIIELILQMKKEKTIVMITHQESLASIADKVVMLRDKHIFAVGSHKHLQKFSSDYYRLWQ